MKITRFNNLWTMGLIIFGAILITFYILKIACPEFIVGVAELPAIVAFGNYVDTHLWAFLIFEFAIGYLGFYLFACACCRKKYLNWQENLIVVGFVAVCLLLYFFAPNLYTPFNYIALILLPFVLLLKNKNLTKLTFTSTAICFAVDIMAQAISMEIRNIVLMASSLNIATLTILLIDTFIWRALLYFYFNHKNEEMEVK